MVISALHLMATRANLRIAHERQQEKALWEEEHGSCGHATIITNHTQGLDAMAASTVAGSLIYTREDKRNNNRISQ